MSSPAFADVVNPDGDTVTTTSSDIDLPGGCSLPATVDGSVQVVYNNSDQSAHFVPGPAGVTFASTNVNVTATADPVTVPSSYAKNGDKFTFLFTTTIGAGAVTGSATVTVTLTQDSYSRSGTFTVAWDCTPATPVDSTPPVVTYTLDPAAPTGDNGWYKGDVALTWQVTDPESAAIVVAGCANATFAADGVFEASCTASSAGGTADPVTVTIQRDGTPPAVGVTGVAGGTTYVLGSVPAAECSTSDATSGVYTAASLTITGGPVGPVTAACSGATDIAGNAAAPATAAYRVIYDWQGFFRPIDNDIVNVAKGGSAIPVKFSLAGNQGLGIFATGYPASKQVACNISAATDDVEETVTAGASSLGYDPTADQYSYAWKTDKSWAGTCRQLQVKLDDGTTHSATFQFK